MTDSMPTLSVGLTLWSERQPQYTSCAPFDSVGGPNWFDALRILYVYESLSEDQHRLLYDFWEAPNDERNKALIAAMQTKRWSLHLFGNEQIRRVSKDNGIDAAHDAYLATLVKDAIRPHEYQTLMRPWIAVMGR